LNGTLSIQLYTGDSSDPNVASSGHCESTNLTITN
jgi:hypothetical protein